MCGSSLPPVVCSRAHFLFTLVELISYSGIQQILCCVFVLVILRLVHPMLPVSLRCPFLIVIWYSLTFIYIYLFLLFLFALLKVNDL